MFPILNPPPSSRPLPPLRVVPLHQPQASSIVHRTWTGESFHIWYYTCFNAILPNHPTLSLSHRVQKTVLCISVLLLSPIQGYCYHLSKFHIYALLLLLLLSHVQLCVTPYTAAHQAPPSLGFSSQEHWSRLPFPSPMRESEVAQLCPTLSDPMDCSLPGSPSMGFFRQEYWSGMPLPSLIYALVYCIGVFLSGLLHSV